MNEKLDEGFMWEVLEKDSVGFVESAEGLIKIIGLCAQRGMRIPAEQIMELYQKLKVECNI